MKKYIRSAFSKDVKTLSDIEDEIFLAIDAGTTKDDIEDYLVELEQDGTIDRKEFKDLKQSAFAEFDRFKEALGCINCSDIEPSSNRSGDDIARKIENLFKKEDIPYRYVECIDDDPVMIVAITYGDWKNDNDRADYLVETNFHPSRTAYEDKDPYDYFDDAEAERFIGSDSCVTKHEWIWE